MALTTVPLKQIRSCFRYEGMTYRHEATSVAGFIQQLAVAYLTHGYWFFVTGVVPDGKDPPRTDAKLLGRYGVDRSRWARTRRKEHGLANVR